MLEYLGEDQSMINKLVEKFFNRKFLTFAVIGAFNTVLANVLYFLFVENNMFDVGTASLVGDVIPMFFSYFLNMRYTYHERPTLKSALSFPLSYVPGFIINMVITVFVAQLGVVDSFAKLVSLPISIPVNFLCMSFIVKKTKS